jgi:hypothetical protein
MLPEAMTYVCPFCNCEVRVGKPCLGCAKKSGTLRPKKRPWHQNSAEDGLNLPNEDFDYDAFVTEEFGKAPHQVLGLKWYWWLLAIVVLIAVGWGALVIR